MTRDGWLISHQVEEKRQVIRVVYSASEAALYEDRKVVTNNYSVEPVTVMQYTPVETGESLCVR
jgi:hypothetical protein